MTQPFPGGSVCTRVRPLASVLFLLLACTAAASEAPGSPVGEWRYVLLWNGLPAGSASVRVDRDEKAGTYVVEGEARTNALVDLFWRLRASLRSVVDASSWRPRRYELVRKKSKKRKVVEVAFSRDGAVGWYSRRGKVTVRKVEEPRILDPVAAALRALAFPLRTNEPYSYRVFTGRALYEVEARILGREKVRVPAGEFEAWKAFLRVVRVPREAREKKDDDEPTELEIWLAGEKPSVPVRVEGKLAGFPIGLELEDASTPPPRSAHSAGSGATAATRASSPG
ncbi:MAG: hypothetical protein KatS3mg076_2744 [Candidatus Binatia bacterium]|nr:MAG: hypothetical protein KatS3mg076_2744 [Candidatus Binatia bacterium]